MPAWDSKRLFQLYRKIKTGRSNARDRDEHSRLLMVLFCAHVGRRRRLITTWQQQHMDPEWVAAQVLEHAVLTTPKIKLRKENQVPAALLDYYHTCFKNKITSMLRASAGKPLPESDSQFLDTDGEERLLKIMARADVHEWRVCEGLRAVEEEVLNDAFNGAREDGRNPHPRWLQKLYRFCYIKLFHTNAFPTYEELPARLRRQVTDDDHTYCIYRIVKHVESIAREQ